MKERKIDHTLLAYILTLLNSPAGGTADPSQAYGMIRFMDEMPGGFLIYHANQEEQIIYANKALLRICQCDTLEEFREMTGNSFQGFVHPDDLATVERSIREQVADSQYDLDYVEYRVRRKDGEILWVEDYGHFIQSDAAGDIFYVFIGDATEKKQMQQAILAEQVKKEQALKNLIDHYHNEIKMISQEHLRRLEVIEGLSINYESILYADLDHDRIQPYRLSNRTLQQFENTEQPRSFTWYTADYIRIWVHPEDREAVAMQTAPAYIREQLLVSKTYYINYKVMKDGEIQYLQLRIVNVGNSGQVSQIVLGYRRVDDEVRREMEQKQLLKEALNNAKLAITAKNILIQYVPRYAYAAECDIRIYGACQGQPA